MTQNVAVTPTDVLKFKKSTAGYLCPLNANTFGIEFQKFEIRGYNNEPVYISMTDGNDGLDMTATANFDMQTYEDRLRSIRYTFKKQFLDFDTVRTLLEFKIGEQPLNNFRMIELHYFKDKLIRTYDFEFGFCIPNSVNTWEAIYDVPKIPADQKQEYINSPYAHKSDSFYFVDNQLVMHNKAEYRYQ